MRPAAAVATLVAFVLPSFAGAAEMRVAIMEFRNATASDDLAALGKGLQSMVTTDLANVQAIRVVERERLKDVQGELKLSHGQGFDKDTAAKIGKLAGATHLFSGSYTVVGDKMRLDGRMIVVSSGDVLLAEQITGDKALFFELEQQLVQKVIALLGVKLAPKERAVLQRAQTADFDAFKKFSEGLQAFDDGRLDVAIKALNEATAIDKDFKLASLTLDEYERLATQVRAKAAAAGKVEDEVARLEKNKAIAAGVAVLRKLWPILDSKGDGPELKQRRMAAACALADAYRSKLGYQNRGPVTGEDLVAAGFDDFTLRRTADALFARAWAEAPGLFPRLPPLCVGLHMLSDDSKRSIDDLLRYDIADAAKLAKDHEALLSYMTNDSTFDEAATWLHLDTPQRIKLWEKLYELARTLPDLRDQDRREFEERIALLRRAAGDFDGSTQMFAAASRHTKDSYQLSKYAEEIDRNKELKLKLAGAPPIVREIFLLGHEVPERELKSLNDPRTQKELNDSVWRGREIAERGQNMAIVAGLPLWRMSFDPWGVALRTGPRTTSLRADDVRYEGTLSGFRRDEKPKVPTLLASGVRGRRLSFRVTIDQSPPPPEWPRLSKQEPRGGGEVGVLFGLNRLSAAGGIKHGVPPTTIGYALTVADGEARLIQVLRDGELRLQLKVLGTAALPAARAGKRLLEVTVDPGKVVANVDGARVSLPWQPEGDTAEGFAGFVFNGLGYAAIGDPSISVR
jgi:TolB-like protein